MIKYTVIHEDDLMTYYYNLEDEFIYAERKQMDKTVVQKGASIGGTCGAFSVLAFNGEAWSPQDPCILFVALMILGLLLGWGLAFWSNNKAGRRVFVPENKVIMTQKEMINMYKNSKRERRKYWILFLVLLVFSIVCTFMYCYMLTNDLLVFCCVLMWFVVGVLFFVARPICRIKMKWHFIVAERNI